MPYTKSTKPLKFKFGVYTVSKKYIKYLKKTDNNVTDPDVTNRYVGPVYIGENEKGVFGFMVPVSPEWHASKGYFASFENGIYAKYFDFTKMIPCTNPQFLKTDDSDPALIAFCTNSKDEFEDCAEQILNT